MTVTPPVGPWTTGTISLSVVYPDGSAETVSVPVVSRPGPPVIVEFDDPKPNPVMSIEFLDVESEDFLDVESVGFLDALS